MCLVFSIAIFETMSEVRHGYTCWKCVDCMSVEKTYCSVLIDLKHLQERCKKVEKGKFLDVFHTYCQKCDDLRMQVPVGESGLNQLSYLKRKLDIMDACKNLGIPS